MYRSLVFSIVTELYSHHHNQLWNILSTPKNPRVCSQLSLPAFCLWRLVWSGVSKCSWNLCACLPLMFCFVFFVLCPDSHPLPRFCLFALVSEVGNCPVPAGQVDIRPLASVCHCHYTGLACSQGWFMSQCVPIALHSVRDWNIICYVGIAFDLFISLSRVFDCFPLLATMNSNATVSVCVWLCVGLCFQFSQTKNGITGIV